MAEVTIAGSNQTSAPGGSQGEQAGSGFGIGEGYAQAGASTFATAVNWLTYGQEKKQIERYRQQDLARAEVVRHDTLAQQGIQNLQQQQQIDLSYDTFDFGKQKWGEEFGFTKEQYRDQMKRQKESDLLAKKDRGIAYKKQALKGLVDNMNQTIGNDLQMKQFIASNLSR